MFLTTADFTGKHELSTGVYSDDKITEYIERYEKKYLLDLFGADLYAEFMSDLLNNVPQSPNFIELFNAFAVDGVHGKLMESRGIIDMLKGFIYFEYSRDLMTQQTPVGEVRQNGENSTGVTFLASKSITTYNESVTSFRAIQYRLLYTPNDFKVGQVVSYSIINEGTGYNTISGIITANAGTGVNLKFTIEEVGEDGNILEIAVVDQGYNYLLNQELSIPTGDGNAVLKVTYAGIGNANKFRGQTKRYMTWL